MEHAPTKNRNKSGKEIDRSNLLAKNNFNCPRSAHFFVHFFTTLYGGRYKLSELEYE